MYEKQLPEPLANRMTTGTSMFTLVVSVDDSEAVSGLGYGWTIGTQRAELIRGSIQAAAMFSLGRNPQRIEELWSDYLDVVNFVGREGLAAIGMSVMDIALWDQICKRTSLPLWIILGGHKERVPIYKNVIDYDLSGSAPVEVLREHIGADIDSGYQSFKLRVGLSSLRDDVRRVRRLVSGFSDEITWAIDVAQRWDRNLALRGCTALDDLGLLWIEDPLPAHDVTGLHDLTERVATPLCVGENAYLLTGASAVVQHTHCRYLMLDLQRCGGVTGWRKAAAMAEASEVLVTPHVYPGIGIHLAGGTANSPIAENMSWWEDLFGPVRPNPAGEVMLAGTIGAGLDIEIADESGLEPIWQEEYRA